MYYPSLVEYIGPSHNVVEHLRKRIRVKDKPGHTNMSREERVEGWLGTTNDWDEVAIGEFDADALRALLKDHGVQIPDDIPVQAVDYSIDTESSEWYNQKFAYVGYCQECGGFLTTEQTRARETVCLHCQEHPRPEYTVDEIG